MNLKKVMHFLVDCLLTPLEEDDDKQYKSVRENQIDVETGEVISVETKRAGV